MKFCFFLTLSVLASVCANENILKEELSNGVIQEIVEIEGNFYLFTKSIPKDKFCPRNLCTLKKIDLTKATGQTDDRFKISEIDGHSYIHCREINDFISFMPHDPNCNCGKELPPIFWPLNMHPKSNFIYE